MVEVLTEDILSVAAVVLTVSAMIGVLAHLAAPDLFSALILLGPSARYLDEGDYVGGFSRTTSAQYDARIITLTLVVPTDYTCNTSVATGCWLKVKLDFTGAPADTTTWSASLLGDPVRLVE